MKLPSPIILCWAALVSASSAADSYIGAASLIKKAEQAAASRPATTPALTLRSDLATFAESSKKLPPEEAAQKWVGFSDRIQTQRNRDYDSIPFEDLARALPSPSAWKFLREAAGSDSGVKNKEIRAGRLVLTWYADRLLGDSKALVADFNKIADAVPQNSEERRRYGDQQIDNLAGQTLALIAEPGARTSFLNDRLDAQIASAKEIASARASANAKGQAIAASIAIGSGRERRSDEISIPDVAAMIDSAAAERLVRKALFSSPIPLDIPRASATFRLAARLATENVAELACAQWQLTETRDGGRLYDLMAARFGQPSGSDRVNASALAWAFYRALARDEADEAASIAKMAGPEFSPSTELLAQLVDEGHGSAVCSALRARLATPNDRNRWRDYIDLSIRAGQVPSMLAFLDEAIASSAPSSQTREELENERVSALLAIGKTTEAVELIQKHLQSQKAAGHLPGAGSSATRLAGIGLMLDRKEWLDEGITEALAAFNKLETSPASLAATYNLATDLSELLVNSGRGPEAEAVLMKLLTAEVTPSPGQQASYYPRGDTNESLTALVGIYADGNRPADVVTLVEEAPWWGAADLSKIFNSSCSLSGHRSASLGVLVAKALASTGRKAEATKLIEAMIPHLTGEDAAYALLVELKGQEAIPILDRLASADAFEERPLIWKAKLLLDAGRLAEAETVVRKAISIDPSDGEQGPGDRMRAYSVLGDILEARGDAENAKIFRGVVESIRMSERADRLQDLGLTSDAIKLYEASLTHFADAYCVQSRLARRLAEAGDWKAAEEHYRRAFELMPQSFGRMESHCFGCERAFAGQPQQTIAEKVFTQLAKERPDLPQVPYLLGYLYNEQGRQTEAVAEFRKAVELDPDYINAWKKLDSAPDSALTPEDHERIAENLIRLDPSGNHRGLDLDAVANLSKIWKLLEAAEPFSPTPLANLLPLPASRNLLESLVIAAKAESGLPDYFFEDRISDRPQTPAGEFANQSFSRSAGNLFDNSSYFED